MWQKVMFIGNLGRDPEMRYTPGGQAVTNMNVAANRVYYSNEEKVTETIWYRVAVWGNQAEACNQYLQQGSRVFVEGTLKPDENGNPRIWQRSDGSPAASYEVTARHVKFLSSRQGGQRQEKVDEPDQSYLTGERGRADDYYPEDEDEIPF